jgi:hypothetical protein
MVTLDMTNKESYVSGKWGNSYTFTSTYELNELSMIMKNNTGTIIAKWSGDWVIRPFSRKEKKAAREIMEFLYFRTLVSICMKRELIY